MTQGVAGSNPARPALPGQLLWPCGEVPPIQSGVRFERPDMEPEPDLESRPTESPRRTIGSRLASIGIGALGGIACAAAGLGAAEVVAGLSARLRSPVLDVGDRVVDRVPRWAKELAIEWFGTKDKIALLAGIGILLALYAAVLGLLAWSGRRRLALGGAATFGILGAWAALASRTGTDWVKALPSITGAAVAAGALYLIAPRTATGGSPDRAAGGHCGPSAVPSWQRGLPRHRHRPGLDRPLAPGAVQRRRVPSRHPASSPRGRRARRTQRRVRSGCRLLLHAQPGLLPDRHRARRAAGAGGGVDVAGDRHGRPRTGAHLRRHPRPPGRRERHHAHLRVEHRRRRVHRHGAVAGDPARRPARRGRDRVREQTRSSAGPSTATRAGSRSTRWMAGTRSSPSV